LNPFPSSPSAAFRMNEIDLRYLEGSSAIGQQMRDRTGMDPDAERIAFSQSCMLHGRLFWESAIQAPLETRPLLLYYGAAAFAKALISVMTGCRPTDFKPSHGLTCRAAASGLIADFAITVTARRVGLFQQFNDVAASLNRLSYLEATNSRTKRYPTAASERLSGFGVCLADCLARIPGLEQAYRLATGDEPRMLSLTFSDESFLGRPGAYSIRVDVPGSFDDVSALAPIIESVRNKAPFLRQWGLSTATSQWDHTILYFGNVSPPIDELSFLRGGAPHFVVETGQPLTPFDALESIPPLAGGYSRSASVTYIDPLCGEQISEFSIMFAALLGLSYLVRYHPHTWTACVHRRPLASRSVDEMLLPVIETFLGEAQVRFPQFVADAILGR
jgi:hypothetical protein